MKCKICGQEAGWLYLLLSFGRCVHCELYIERKLNPINVSEEWIKHSEKSEEACDKWLEQNKKDGKGF